MNRFYKLIPSGEVMKYHNFSVDKGAPTIMKFSVADGEDVKVNDGKTREQRIAEMRAATPSAIPFPGIKEIKQVELYKKWRKYVPTKQFKDEACPKPADDLLVERQRLERTAK
jgi:hypothetical protein